MTKVAGLGLEITELRLGLPGGNRLREADQKNEKKRMFCDLGGDEEDGEVKTKSLAVGWPPVCSYRKRASKAYIKVSMDGVPFLRKIDLATHEGYSQLVSALENLFGCYGIAEALIDADGSEYTPIYEDKDGDWMLVGDVPWKMFVETCKRLRIMKKSDAKGFGLQSLKLNGRMNVQQYNI